MERFAKHIIGLFAILTVGLGLMLSACGSDSTGPSGPVGSSVLKVMHTNPGFTSDVLFRASSDTGSTRGSYGQAKPATITNGSRKIDIRATDGTVLTSQDIVLDSAHSVWVFFTGNSTERESFSVSDSLAKPSGTNAAIRIVNASKNLQPATIKIGDATGATLASNISYKNASDYTSVAPSTTTTLVVVSSSLPTAPLQIDLTGKLQAGKGYTIVLFGSTDAAADPSVKLAAQLIMD